jgi:predicted unusual protein kinase regulating ubiquinone biosynthesis (AarF/ABC1/UbiB family)
MGGVMIKVGQFLSSRLDVLPPEVTDELANLQDEVPAEPYATMRELAEKELGASLAEKFEWFDESPLAAASLGQVHRARLRVEEEADGFRNVVVKVQRPFIELIVEVDLSALKRVGHWLMKYRPVREHADVPALLREFSGTVREEIDYLHEAENAETFFEMFKDDEDVHVPRVVRRLTTLRVLTLEDVYAIKITDYAAITTAGIERGEVARKLLSTYLKQIFEDGFVHADPHPGNLFVTPLNGEGETPPRWKLTFVDFGMVARVPDGVRAGLREMLIGVGTKDAGRVVRAYQQLGMLLPGADLRLIEQAEAQVFDRFWGMSMSELRRTDLDEMRKFAHQYRDLIFSMPFQVPNNLIMLGRTVAILSGMCTGLNPQFNVWTGLEPFAQKLIADEVSGAGLEFWLAEAGNWVRTVAGLPRRLESTLARLERGDVSLNVPRLERQLGGVEAALRRVTAAVVFAGLLLAGVQLVLASQALAGGVLLGGAGLAALWMLVLPGRRR